MRNILTTFAVSVSLGGVTFAQAQGNESLKREVQHAVSKGVAFLVKNQYYLNKVLISNKSLLSYISILFQ